MGSMSVVSLGMACESLDAPDGRVHDRRSLRAGIVWDAVEVIEFSRKHTANVGEALAEIRRLIHRLVQRRDERRDSFAKVIAKAMSTTLGSDDDEVSKLLAKHGIGRNLAKEALESAKRTGRFTIFSVVDALTRQATEIANAGDRTEADQAASSLLALAAS
jgi:predicted GNAT family acetyltransferase